MRAKTLLTGTGATVLAGALVACGPTVTVTGPTSSPTPTGTSPATPTVPESSTTPPQPADSGGTLHYLYGGSLNSWDPQQMYIGLDVANAGRLFTRSLVQYPASDDPATASTPVPDLAVGTGRSSDDAKTWSFTLKDDVRWQDGTPVTCADLKYGVSRSFAIDVFDLGPRYAIEYLDVPSTGSHAFEGPYTSSAGEAAFDKAVTCDGKTITYHFRKPWPDFPRAIASLRAFDPYRKDKDHGKKSNLQVFSDGPYKLQGTWTSSGGTFVRNPEYDASTDPVRKARPDRIVFQTSTPATQSTTSITTGSGTGEVSVTSNQVPQSMADDIDSDHLEIADSPYVDYLIPNFRRLKNPKVRKALKFATSRRSWVMARGGNKWADPAYSIVNPNVHGYRKNPGFTAVPESGDIAKAKKMLKSAGVKLPYRIKLIYTGGDKKSAVKAVTDGWAKAGFKVKTQQIDPAKYYSEIGRSDKDADIMWMGWGADWPTMTSVLPPLFDSDQLGDHFNGSNYGRYKNADVDDDFDRAVTADRSSERVKAYRSADRQLAKGVAYIPLSVEKFVIPWGEDVTHYTAGAATSMYPDLGVIGVKK